MFVNDDITKLLDQVDLGHFDVVESFTDGLDKSALLGNILAPADYTLCTSRMAHP